MKHKKDISTSSTKGRDVKNDVVTIWSNGTKYLKMLLKIITKMNPVLFGQQYVGKKQRPNSGLYQTRIQRSIPITENEYNEIMKITELK